MTWAQAFHDAGPWFAVAIGIVGAAFAILGIIKATQR
jgi:hypothetical protein